ncbi:hypothetical protein [Aestuariivivens sediminicola]|uniref:hypothetical protein n=1 Tax=Aestuariivivens sediminicola TaxID=2913560 RepID=UPI001F561F0D|nr:hypothetical protein [Aestuariivivens sediminicola]
MKPFLLIVFALITGISLPQEGVSFFAFQDVRLSTVGDNDHHYEPFTLDLYVGAKLQLKQDRYGYGYLQPSFEYADLKSPYKRYAVNLGYCFNSLLIDHLEASLSAGYGKIIVKSASSKSYGFDATLSYKLNAKLKLSSCAQFVDRTDLAWQWKEADTLKFSWFAGIEIKLK